MEDEETNGVIMANRSMTVDMNQPINRNINKFSNPSGANILHRTSSTSSSTSTSSSSSISLSSNFSSTQKSNTNVTHLDYLDDCCTTSCITSSSFDETTMTTTTCNSGNAAAAASVNLLNLVNQHSSSVVEELTCVTKLFELPTSLSSSQNRNHEKSTSCLAKPTMTATTSSDYSSSSSCYVGSESVNNNKSLNATTVVVKSDEAKIEKNDDDDYADAICNMSKLKIKQEEARFNQLIANCQNWIQVYSEILAR